MAQCINLPGISGVRAPHMLRENSTTTDRRFDDLGVHARSRDIKRGLNAGFFRALTEPTLINKASHINEVGRIDAVEQTHRSFGKFDICNAHILTMDAQSVNVRALQKVDGENCLYQIASAVRSQTIARCMNQTILT